jgi:hypothetical protein
MDELKNYKETILEKVGLEAIRVRCHKHDCKRPGSDDGVIRYCFDTIIRLDEHPCAFFGYEIKMGNLGGGDKVSYREPLDY